MKQIFDLNYTNTRKDLGTHSSNMQKRKIYGNKLHTFKKKINTNLFINIYVRKRAIFPVESFKILSFFF